jgi:hypothetical protein
MKKNIEIELEDQTFVLAFDYAFQRELANLWGFTGYQQVVMKFYEVAGPWVAQFDGKDVKNMEVSELDIPYAVIDMFIDFLKAASASAGNKMELSDGVIGNYVLSSPDLVLIGVQGFLDSMPKVKPAENPGKPKPANKMPEAQKN